MSRVDRLRRRRRHCGRRSLVDEPEALLQLSELGGHLGAVAPSRASRFCSQSRTTWSSAWPGSDRTSETPAVGRRWHDALCKALTCSSCHGTPQTTPSGGNGWPPPAGAPCHAARRYPARRPRRRRRTTRWPTPPTIRRTHPRPLRSSTSSANSAAHSQVAGTRCRPLPPNNRACQLSRHTAQASREGVAG